MLPTSAGAAWAQGSGQEFGIRGGTTEQERHLLKRRRRIGLITDTGR